MSKFGNAISAIHQASESRGDYAKSEYLKIKEGETKTIRFISAFRDMVIYNCPDANCPCKGAEISKEEYEELKAAGRNIVCPICGKVVTDEMVVGERPAFVPSMLHMGERVMQNDGSQAWRSFLCLSDSPDQKDAAGNPLYPCPICAQLNKDGKQKRPSMRLTGIAVVRQKITEQVPTATGQMVNKVVGVQDEMVDGKPHVVIVQMGVNNFFKQLMAIDETSPVQFFDFDITRSGNGLDTSYMFTPLTQADMPQPVPMSNYAEFMPDIESLLCAIGSPKYYAKNGYSVQGYIPDDDDNDNSGNDVANQQNMAYNQGVQSANPQGGLYVQNPLAASVMPTQTVSFDQVAGQMNGYAGQGTAIPRS